MTLNLPNLELKYTKVTEKNDTNTNNNTINNQIIINEKQTNNQEITTLSQSNSTQNIQRTETPLNIKQFKETLLTVLISYFKNNIVLLNN
jgi:hypothetical protein